MEQPGQWLTTATIKVWIVGLGWKKITFKNGYSVPTLFWNLHHYGQLPNQMGIPMTPGDVVGSPGYIVYLWFVADLYTAFSFNNKTGCSW